MSDIKTCSVEEPVKATKPSTKAKVNTKPSNTTVVKFPVEALAKSKAFATYQKDLIKVVLGTGLYTKEEAKTKLDNFLNKKVVK